MIPWLIDLFTNPFLITAVFAWFVAQVMKAIIYAIVHKEFVPERFIGDGGMPSGHSATVSSVAMMSLLIYGPNSYAFAISTILAIIVCHDAMGVRRETGKQAVVIKEMYNTLSELDTDELAEARLKEFVGHSPLQVVVGIAIGIISGGIAYLLWFS